MKGRLYIKHNIPLLLLLTKLGWIVMNKLRAQCYCYIFVRKNITKMTKIVIFLSFLLYFCHFSTRRFPRKYIHCTNNTYIVPTTHTILPLNLFLFTLLSCGNDGLFFVYILLQMGWAYISVYPGNSNPF